MLIFVVDHEKILFDKQVSGFKPKLFYSRMETKLASQQKW